MITLVIPPMLGLPRWIVELLDEMAVEQHWRIGSDVVTTYF